MRLANTDYRSLLKAESPRVDYFDRTLKFPGECASSDVITFYEQGHYTQTFVNDALWFNASTINDRLTSAMIDIHALS